MRDYIIHLIRHGATLANEEGKYIGRTDLPLTPGAIAELEDLREEGIYPSVGMVYSSPLSRCIKTATTIYPGKQLIAVENLMEYDFGEFEGKSDPELDSREDYRTWRAGRTTTATGGEDMKTFEQRVYSSLVQIVGNMMENDCYEAAVVTHGGVIMTLLGLCGLPQRQRVEWITENGKGYTIRVNPSIFQRSGYVEVTGTIPEM
jgi:alpha-ribazole phosphatase